MVAIIGSGSVFLIAASVLDIVTVKGVGPTAIVAVLILVLGFGLRVEWFLPAVVAGWALLSVPVLVALGASEATRDRLAVLILTLMATTLGRLIAEVRGTPGEHETGDRAIRGAGNGQGEKGGQRWAW